MLTESTHNNHNNIEESFQQARVPAIYMDWLWAHGWRHFGVQFFRYNTMAFEDMQHEILALRTCVSDFALSKSQRRTWRRNADLQTVIRPVVIDDEKQTLFFKHRERFKQYIPDSLGAFLSPRPSHIPCQCMEVCVLENDRLVAVSFLDIGVTAVSSVYAMFDPELSGRRLGIYTMLLELDLARRLKKQYYYSGYTTRKPSHYDYKKCFDALEAYDFVSDWRPYPRTCA